MDFTYCNNQQLFAFQRASSGFLFCMIFPFWQGLDIPAALVSSLHELGMRLLPHGCCGRTRTANVVDMLMNSFLMLTLLGVAPLLAPWLIAISCYISRQGIMTNHDFDQLLVYNGHS